MKTSLLWLVLPLLLPLAIRAAPPSAEALLEASIAYHDPEERFLGKPHRLVFRDERPGKTDRHVEILIDIPGERFEMLQRTEVEIRGEIAPGHCAMTLDGRSELTEEERNTHRLTCDRLAFFRNYYTYLWGLPMKLQDPGTHLGQPVEDTFDGQAVYALQATYDESVGSDIWTFYFDRETSALVGYLFHRDETRTTGETILLEGEYAWDGMRLPKSRAWYHLEGDSYLGTDHLVEIGPPQPTKSQAATSWVGPMASQQYFAVSVSDMDSSVAWYARAFGLEVLDDTSAEDGKWRIVNLTRDELFVELVQSRRDVPKETRTQGFFKVGFEVPSLKPIADRIEASGEPRPRILDFERHGIRLMQIKDPDGNTVQLLAPLVGPAQK